MDYGATPDDATDDRAAIQAALDAASGGTLCIPEGRFVVGNAPVGSYNRFAGVSTHGQHTGIHGSGPSTVLALEGDRGGAGINGILAIDPGAADVTIRDFTIDTSGAWNTGEQTHGIQIGSGVGTGTVTDIRVERVRFVHPLPLVGRSGDCLRLLGSSDGLPAGAVTRVTVVGSTFLRCARSGVSVQRNVHDLTVTASQFESAGDQDIDVEPTGGGAVSGLVISGNALMNETSGDGILLWSVQDTTVLGNDIAWSLPSPTASGVRIRPTVASGERILILGNRVYRAGYSLYLHSTPLTFGSVSVVGNMGPPAHCTLPPSSLTALGNTWGTTCGV
ncbi:MAG: right-handed parallel beta-helix repeat-containing protein [Candidatus Methylomirabilales bacterium]